MNTYRVWYARRPHFGMGPRPILKDLQHTHVCLGDFAAGNLEDLFCRMQAENWSSNGEGRPLILGMGLHHTSMSVGDVAEDVRAKKFYLAECEGFSEL